MKKIPDGYWEALKDEFDGKLIAEVQKRLSSSDPIFLSAGELGSELDCEPKEIVALLERLVKDGLLSVQEAILCPQCRQSLGSGELERLLCGCGHTLHEDNLPKITRNYWREGQRSRDLRWVITVHGMNTPGTWQQDFSWRLAQLYGYAIPVGLYKYGNIKVSPFVVYRQNRHRDQLLAYLRRLRDEMMINKYGERPDAIAHSFGTWLLAQAMLADKTADPIKLGRVILTGSIIRPDFEWSTLLQNGRVEAVMCHCGGRDVPVRIAHFFIPNSGPSGIYEFNDQDHVVHKFEKTFGHSDYFTKENLARVLRERWAPFLTSPLETIKDLRDGPNSLVQRPWKAWRLRIVTFFAKTVLLIALLVGSIVFLMAIPFGLPRLFQILCSLT